MQNVIRVRLRQGLTLRLTPRVPAPPSPPPKKLRIKLKLKSRQAFAGITNLSVPRAADSENDDAPAVVVSSSPSQTSRRRAFKKVRVPGPFRRIRHLQKGCISEAVAVRDINGRREHRGRVLCLKIFSKKEAVEKRSRHVILEELLAYKAISAVTSLRGEKWLPFVMRLDASLEDASSLYFAMVSSLQLRIVTAYLHIPNTGPYGLRFIRRTDELVFCGPRNLQKAMDCPDCKLFSHLFIVLHLPILRSQAAGISALHQAGILHRDIKPENILIDFQRNIRIADLGCAFLNDDNKPLHRLGEYSTEVCGTWPYQAPELLANEGRAPVDKRKYGMGVDYWALGCIIFEFELDGSRVSVHRPTFYAIILILVSDSFRHHG
jgi:serine/threonine protein kinase